MAGMVKFNPYIHIPVTDGDRSRIENALWEGWELMVDPDGGVWIGAGEERIAAVKPSGRKEG